MIDEIRFFKRTEVLIEEYAKILRSAALMIRSHLDHISPMPPELIELLRHQTSASSLKNCITVLEFNATSLISKRDQLRSELANADVSEAASIISEIPFGTTKSLENVVGSGPYQSNLLPPAYVYFSELLKEIDHLFPRVPDSPLVTAKERDFATYLVKVENPWAKYAL